MHAQYPLSILCLLFMIYGYFSPCITKFFEQYANFVNKKLIFKLIISAALSFAAAIVFSKTYVYLGYDQGTDNLSQMPLYSLTSAVAFMTYLMIMCCSSSSESHAKEATSNHKYFAIGFTLTSIAYTLYCYYYTPEHNIFSSMAMLNMCHIFIYILALRYFANKIMNHTTCQMFSILNTIKIALFSFAYTVGFCWFFAPQFPDTSTLFIGAISFVIYYAGFLLISLYGCAFSYFIFKASKHIGSALSAPAEPYQGLIFTIAFPLLSSAVGLCTLKYFANIDTHLYGSMSYEALMLAPRYLMLMYIYSAFSNKSYRDVLLCK